MDLQPAGRQFGVVNIELGQTPRPDVEQKILDEVGSYGRQIGRIGEAPEVLLDHVEMQKLSRKEKQALGALRDQLKAVRKVKKQTEQGPPATGPAAEP